MSILIKGMEMPESCMNCMFCGFAGANFELDTCQITGNAQKHIPYSKMSDCPLVEVPEDVQPVKWISVTERLPSLDEDVLVCAYGTLIRTWCLHKKYSKRFWETEEGYFDDFNAVSHWMPLPEPPKEEEK